MPIKKKVISVVLFAGIFYNTISVFAYILGITRYTQEKSNWYWAACAKMGDVMV